MGSGLMIESLQEQLAAYRVATSSRPSRSPSPSPGSQAEEGQMGEDLPGCQLMDILSTHSYSLLTTNHFITHTLIYHQRFLPQAPHPSSLPLPFVNAVLSSTVCIQKQGTKTVLLSSTLTHLSINT